MIGKLTIFLVVAVGLSSAAPAPKPFFGPSHEHYVIHVPYHVRNIHHHHVEPYPVVKHVPVPVSRPVPVPVHVPVHVPVYKEVGVPVPVHVPVYPNYGWAGRYF